MIKYLLLLLCLTFSLNADDPLGFWRVTDPKTGKTGSIIAIYEYQGKLYGRIIATLDSNEKLDDSIYDPKFRAPGVLGEPFYSGLDMIWDLKKEGDKYTGGKLIDPEHGKIYDADLWAQNGKLYVRGKVWVFGENEEWQKAQDSDFNDKFKKPDTSKFIPAIPKEKSPPQEAAK